MAKLVLFPFGKKVTTDFEKHPIANALWFWLGGFAMAISYITLGILFCITIIGIPFGLQLFKIAALSLWPFGHEVTAGPNDSGCLSIAMNIIWIIFGGIEIALLHIWFGIICCLTIVGIPLGLQHFKMTLLALVPFGKQIS